MMDTSAIQQEGWDNISTLIAIVNHDDIDGCNGESKGHPSKIDAHLRDNGRKLRDEIRDHIKSQGMGRPSVNGWKHNACHFVEMTY